MDNAKKYFFNTKLSKTIEPLLREEAKGQLDEIKKYFSKRNLISGVRNNYGFHYDPNDLENTISLLPDDKVFYTYVGETYANSLNYFSEELVSTNMLNNITAISNNEAMNHLFGDLTKTGGLLIKFLGEATLTMFERHLDIDECDIEIIDIEPNAICCDTEFNIPFFIKSERMTEK